MADFLPLIVFPQAKTISPQSQQGFGSRKPHLLEHNKQARRLDEQFAKLEADFSDYKAGISNVVSGLEPETVLVIEIAGSVEGFVQAVKATDGLEWLGEWDIEEIEPDEDFYEIPKIGKLFFEKRTDTITREQSQKIWKILKEYNFIDDDNDGQLIRDDLRKLPLPADLEALREDVISAINNAKSRLLNGRLFLSFSNEKGLKEILKLRDIWKEQKALPQGQTKWRDVFSQALRIRRWGIEESLRETGMIERWKDLIDPVVPEEEIHCQVELFYRKNAKKRKENENAVRKLSKELGGEAYLFRDIEEIGFHAAKVKLPAGKISHFLYMVENDTENSDIHLFQFPGVMYVRPTGQSLISMEDATGVNIDFPEQAPELSPVTAILDGVPNLQHKALKDRLSFDDPNDLSLLYQPGEKRHGTSIASLVVHGELSNGRFDPLRRKVYFLPVMQLNQNARQFGIYKEHSPQDVFFEDRIERAVRRMLKGDGNTPPQAPNVKIINLSICNPECPFIHTPSPLARLLDWLSWEHKVLFCVSAGNFTEDIDMGIANAEFIKLPDEQKVLSTLKAIRCQLSKRRLLSPAESLNSLTIGALHADESGNYNPTGHRVDLLPNDTLFSPFSRLGYGFRRSIKPEVLFPGGRQLYEVPSLDEEQKFSQHLDTQEPGQRVAWDSKEEGSLSETTITRGTSNATALATRSGARIYEMLTDLKTKRGEQIQDNLMAVLIKALLVHGAKHDNETKELISEAFQDQSSSTNFRKVVARYIGYGKVDIERVLACTEQRATVIGSGEIQAGEVHQYRFPLPVALSGRKDWRRMVITLAWFSPINPTHRNLREAKLTFQPSVKWDETPLKLERIDSDYRQVSLGTVQHEILERNNRISQYQDGSYLLLDVTCKEDATESLDDAIPYGLAVTLETAEGVGVSIYEQIHTSIKPHLATPETPTE